MWATVAVGASLGAVATGFSIEESPPALVTAVLAAFFGAAALRLAVSSLRRPARRAGLVALLSGLCLWAAGSSLIHQDGSLGAQSFPGPAELLYFPSYLGMAAFVLLDRRQQTRPDAVLWLETVLVCSAVASIAGALIASPLGDVFGHEGLALVLALVYPLLDVSLILLVLGQAVQGSRTWTPDTWLLLGGFLLLTASDVAFLVGSAQQAYFSNLLVDVSYGTAFALVVTGATCRRAVAPLATTTRRRVRTGLVVVAAAVATTTLVLRPADSGSWWATVPAVITLVAAGVRLTAALRQAQGAAEAFRLSRTDELTGLANRRAVLRRLDATLSADEPVALLLIDLDGFKEVNDSLGHAAGDDLLRLVAERLTAAVPRALVARLGGDEFAVVVRDDDPVDLLRQARRIRASLAEPITVEDIEMSVSASVGVAVRGSAMESAVALLRKADVAMYRAKNSRLGETLYDSTFDHYSRARLALMEELRTGIARGELRLWYQPQVDARTGEVVAVEGLVRWEHPQHGLLAPIAFLPQARQAGLMPALSEAVVRAAVQDAVTWQEAGHRFSVGFNCAPPELLGGRVLPFLFAQLDRAGLPRERMTLEVTEESFVSEPERARLQLVALKEKGVRAAIDDYGSGFSSLAYLRDLPVHELKIDRSFVAAATSDYASRVIIESTTALAHAMGLQVVAEGVEDAATAALLRTAGVDVLQGFHVAAPMPPEQLDRWLAGRRALDLRPSVG
ncbi:putative bifunctional diguanylate cyclase/phosphodiesterase [Aquipuribacter sp. SD81]|uniref:putative bifunctional diguanylate cyclase/phosphodiesterase n=1 Tax=Aquipuribacter sp. SD81 TaxID=3127703 RepID=UPI0030163E97